LSKSVCYTDWINIYDGTYTTVSLNSGSWTATGNSKWTIVGSNLYPNNLTDKVGIGTVTPNEVLTVAGNVSAGGEFYINTTRFVQGVRGLVIQPTTDNTRTTLNVAPKGTVTGTNVAQSVIRVQGQDLVADDSQQQHSLNMEAHTDTDSVLRVRHATRSEAGSTPTYDHPDYYWQLNGANIMYAARKKDGTTGQGHIGFFPTGCGFWSNSATWTAGETVAYGDKRSTTRSDHLFLECTTAGTCSADGSGPIPGQPGDTVTDDTPSNTVTWTTRSKLRSPAGSNVANGFHGYYDATPAIWMDQNGYTGIGTIAPKNTLHVDGTLQVSRTGGDPYLKLSDDECVTYLQILDATNKFSINHGLNGAGAERLTIDTNGNVGIGTIEPDYALTVVGDISASGIIHGGVPTGSIVSYAGSSAPTGWLLCDGSTVSRTTYAALFVVTSTTYGVGDGSTTFALPDLRGRAPFGADAMNNSVGSGGGAASRLTGATLVGETSGAETHTLTEGELASHLHSQSQGYNFLADGGGTATGGGGGIWGASGGSAVTSTGGGRPHHNMPPYIVLNYIIKT
jgi:microcystin-dependent protein